MVLNASNTSTRWGLESTFGTAPATIGRIFGIDQKFTRNQLETGLEELGDTGKRTTQYYLDGENKATLTAEWALSTPWPWQLILTGTPTKTGSNPTKHTFVEGNNPKTFTLEHRIDGSPGSGTTNDWKEQYLGCLISSFRMSGQRRGPINCSAEIMAGRVTKTTTGYTAFADATDTNDDLFPYTFRYGELQQPSGTANKIIELQSVDLSIQTGHELFYGWGSGDSTSSHGGKVSYSGSYNMVVASGGQRDKVIDLTEDTDMVLIFDNQVRGSGNADSSGTKRIKITLTNVRYPTSSLGISEVNPLLFDNAFVARGCSVEATTNTANLQS